MAQNLTTTGVGEVRSGGSDTVCSGFFDPGVSGPGTDYSQQNAAQYNGTDLTINVGLNTEVSSASHTFTSADVGNCLLITAGIGWTTGRYIITSVSGGNAFLNASPAAVGVTGGTYYVGGAMATPGYAESIITTTINKCWVKYATYTMTTASAGAAGIVTTVSGAQHILEGYDVTRGDRTANVPIVSWGAVAAPGSVTYIFTITGGTTQVFRNLCADGNTVAKVAGFKQDVAGRGLVDQCIAQNCSGTSGLGFSNQNASNNYGIIRSKAYNCTIGFTNGAFSNYYRCTAVSCGTGFTLSYAAIECLAYACTSHGFIMAASVQLYSCTADGNGGRGFYSNGNNNIFADCVATNNTSYGFDVLTTSHLINCADYANLARNNATPGSDYNPITFTAQPFVDRTNGDFRLNAIAGGGALGRGAGIKVYGQLGFHDVGAVQSPQPVGTNFCGGYVS